MGETFSVSDEELRYRARLYELYYEVLEEDAFQILKRLKIVEADPHPYLDHIHLELEPDFEAALCYFTPRVAIGLFRTARLDVISALLRVLDDEARVFSRVPVGIEELWRWEVEKYMLPD